MSKYLSRIFAAILGVLVLMLLWLMATEGIFDRVEALDEAAASLEEGVLGEPPFGDRPPVPKVDEQASEKGEPPTPPGTETPEAVREPPAPSVALGGTVKITADDLTVVDKRGRKVLQAKLARTIVKLDAMKHGQFLVPHGRVEGARVNLYRDAQGKISIAGALQAAPPSVRGSLALPPEVDHPTTGKWVMDVGPVAIRHAVLTIGFTAQPVKIRIDRGVIHVKQGPDDEKPRIYFDAIEGAFLEPNPLPRPIRIAHAKGLVRLSGRPLVELGARACIGSSELRVRAVVPARKKPVEITGDSAGLGGALGRMGLKIAGKKKADKLVFRKGAVKLPGGPGCEDPTTEDSAKDEP